MNMSKWKDFAEFVALIAVVGGLVAVVVELRQTRSALRAQAYQARALDSINANREWIVDPEQRILLDNYLNGTLKIEDASPDEFVQLRSYFTIRQLDLDNEHYHYQNGFLDPDFYETITKQGIKRNAPQWRAFGIHESRRQFAEEVDRILADPAVKSAQD